MPSFLSLLVVVILGCLAFTGAIELRIPEHEGLTTLLRVVLGVLAVLATNLGIVVALRRSGQALKRPLVIGNVMLLAILLLFLQNKIMVGTQEMRAEVQNVQDRTWLVAFRDLAGTPVDAGQDEIHRLAKRLAGNDRLEPIKIEGTPGLDGDRRIKVTLAEGTNPAAFRDRVTGKPFLRSNPERGLFEVPRGIDLRGGVEFICQLYNDLGARVAADDEILHILRSRLDQRGLTEPTVSRLSNGDVQIVIPGGTPADAARTRKVIEQAGRLEFREVLEVYAAPAPGELPPEVVARPNGGYDLHPDARGSRKQIVAVDRTRDPSEKPVRFYKLGPAELSGKDVSTAERGISEGRDVVDITFTAIGGARNYEFTSRLFSDRQRENALGDSPLSDASRPGPKVGVLAILFDGAVESAPRVQSPSNDRCQISGSFTPEEIDSLRAALRGGSLSVTPVVLSERVVGATLGMDAVRRSISTMLWCFVGILAFMAGYYRRLGIVAVLCMLVTGGLIWSTLSIFGAVLTLPGLAGLVLSIAMSMDTNVLVYERIREEQRAGKDLATAIDNGYSRAFLAILDSNLTTIFSGLILYWIGAGPVKGFGLTLAVGVAVSMFSGVYIGRLITDLLCRGKDKVSMAGLIPEPRLPYVRWRRASYAISVITAVLGLGYFAFGHLLHERGTFNRNFDIDFTGGNLVQATFSEALEPDRVRTALAEAWNRDPKAFDLLDPAELAAPQAYYSGFGGSAASRQWVFRGRDAEGATLEADRADLDAQRGALQREIDAARDPDRPNEARARELEPQVAKLSEQIRALEGRIADRVQVFKGQIAGAFPGLIPEEGSEIKVASWTSPTLTLRLATIEPVQPADATRLQEALAKAEQLASVSVQPEAGGLAITATFREEPRVDALLAGGPISQRLQALLGTDVGNPIVQAAQEVFQEAVTASAGVGIAIAQPFPASQHFSGQVAGAMKTSALLALGLATIAMLAYIAARFEIGFGIAAIASMFHDVLLTLGLIVLFGLRIDLTVVAALLTIIGYSVNDTIVTFDRIRENLKLKPGSSLAEIIDLSIAQTMPRTVLTGGATMLAIALMMIFAGDAIFAFNATLLIGAVLGTYSSIFVAAPMLLAFDRRKLEGTEAPRVDPADQPVEGGEDGEPPKIEAPQPSTP